MVAAKKRCFSAAGGRVQALLVAGPDLHELLDTAAGDCFGKIDVALRIDGDRMAEGEVTGIVSRARNDSADPESAEHGRRGLVHQPDIVVIQIDIDDCVLAGRALGREIVDIRPEIDVA